MIFIRLYLMSLVMEVLVKTCMYGTTSATDSTTMRYYVVKFLYYTAELQEENTTYRQVFKAGELSAKAAYLISMQSNTNWYC